MGTQQNDSLLGCKEEGEYLYRHPLMWIKKSQLLDAYAHAAFQNIENAYECKGVSFVVDFVILPILGSLGIIGNIGGIMCFAKQIRVTYYALMFSLAISDLVTITSFIIYYSFPHWLDYHTFLECPICTYVLLWAYPILHISQLIDLSLIHI